MIRASEADGAMVSRWVRSLYYRVGDDLLALRDRDAEGRRLYAAFAALGEQLPAGEGPPAGPPPGA